MNHPSLPPHHFTAEADNPHNFEAVKKNIGIKIIADIVFSNTASRDLKLDIYRPSNSVKPPVIVWFHGGGFMHGDKSPALPIRLLEAGYALACPQYRLSQEAIFPAPLIDAWQALNFLITNAENLDLDISRLSVMGSSAGGYLAVMAALADRNLINLTPAIKETQRISRQHIHSIIALFAPLDFSQLNQDSTKIPEARLIGQNLGENALITNNANPLMQLDRYDGKLPPLFLGHSPNDKIISIQQSRTFLQRYKMYGGDAQLYEISNSGHEDKVFYNEVSNAKITTFLDSI